MELWLRELLVLRGGVVGTHVSTWVHERESSMLAGCVGVGRDASYDASQTTPSGMTVHCWYG
jgi:hypothetical protein